MDPRADATPLNAPAPADVAALRLLPISIASLDHCAHDLDLYIKYTASPRAALYRGAGVPYTPADSARLAEQGIEFLYIPAQQHAKFRSLLTARLDRLFEDKAQAAAERTRIVRQSATRMLNDALLVPGQPETVGLAAEIAQRFAGWAAADAGALAYILDMGARNLSAAAHMVNVGLGCGMLYAELLRRGLKKGETVAADVALYHQGGLLHDIGQRDIPETILNKEGRLTEDEWDLVRRHPLTGFHELTKVPGISRTVLQMVRDHHERLDGAGYPAGLSGDRLGLPARVCAVVDIFDSLTTARPHRPALSPAEALRIMAHGAGQYFDPVVLGVWRDVVERMLVLDPSRAPQAGSSTATLAELVPSRDRAAPPAPAGNTGAVLPVFPAPSEEAVPMPLPPPPGNRRRYQRFTCSVNVEASFVRRLKQQKEPGPATLRLHVNDISKSGMQVLTPSPLSIDDVLLVRLPGRNGTTTEHKARVVRVRRGPGETWIAGLSFMPPEAGAQPTGAAA